MSRVEQSVEQRLEVVYFDTADLVLAARRVTLRRQTGGDDAGWHLETPLVQDGSRERREPLGDDPGDIPERLLRSIRVYVRDHTLVPVARLLTWRIVHGLRGADDEPLADVRTDRVRAYKLVPSPSNLTWREWKIDLRGGTPALVEAGKAALAPVGLGSAKGASTLARALGEGYPLEAASAPRRAHPKDPAGRVLLAYAHAQVQALTVQDPRMRGGESDSIHAARVATRRLRSALATYRGLMDATLADDLRTELKWLAGALGGARDAQVLRERLETMVAAEPAVLILGPVSERIATHLGADYDSAYLTAIETLNDARYFRLLDALDALLAAPPLTGLAAKPAHKVVPGLVGKDWRRLRAAVRSTGRITDPAARDTALHEARKRAKRLRYAAEAAIPVHGKRSARLAGAAKGLQDVLGDHVDGVVARDLLLRLGVEAQLFGENGFSYGRLHALEQRAAAESESGFLRAWNAFPRP